MSTDVPVSVPEPAGISFPGGAKPSAGSGPNAHSRPKPLISSLLGTIAGLFLVSGLVVALVVALKVGDGRLMTGIVGVVLAVVGFVLFRLVPEPARTAPTIMVSVGAIAATVSLLGFPGFTSNKFFGVIILAVVAVIHLVLWKMNIMADRNWMFAIGVLGAESAVLTLVGVLTRDNVYEEFGYSEDVASSTRRAFTEGKVPLAIAGAVIGVAMLFGARWLAQRGKQGLATPMLLGGGLGASVGLTGLQNNQSIATLLALLGVGAVMMFIGADIDRRGTAWIGTGLVAISLAGLVGKTVDSPGPGGIVLLFVGLVALGASVATAARMPSAPSPDA